MSWLRIDDGFIDHPKVLEGGERLGRFGVGRVIGQFLEGLAYASNKLTDGFLAVSAVKRFKVDPKPLQVAEVMVGVGLWHAVEGGYRIHDYHHYNPTAASVREKRTKDRTRKQDGDAQDSARNPGGENSARARKSQSQSGSPDLRSGTGGVLRRTEDGVPTGVSPPAADELKTRAGAFCTRYRWTFYPEIQGVAYTPQQRVEVSDLESATRLAMVYTDEQLDTMAQFFLTIPEERERMFKNAKRTITMLLNMAEPIAKKLWGTHAASA